MRTAFRGKPMTPVAAGEALTTLPARVARAIRRVEVRDWLTFTPLVFAAALVLFVARRPQVLLTPEFRGEDGQVFYLGTWFGATPLTPYQGFLHIVPRAVGLLERLVPVGAAPFLGNLVAVALTAGIVTYVATRLRTEPATRAALAFLIVVLPGVTETHGSITWAPWYLAAFLVAVPFAHRPSSNLGRWIEAAAVLVAGLGAPLVIVLAPLYLVVRGRLMAAAWIAAAAQLVVALTATRVATAPFDLPGLIPFALVRAIVEPFLGWQVVTHAGPSGALLLATGIVPLLVMALRRAPRGWLLLAGYVWATTLLAVVLRTSEPLGQMVDGLSANRYLFLPGLAVVGLVVAMAIRGRRPAAVGLCVLLAIGIAADFVIPAHPVLDWADRSACIGGPAPCMVPVYPEDVFSVRWPGSDGSYDPGAQTSR